MKNVKICKQIELFRASRQLLFREISPKSLRWRPVNFQICRLSQRDIDDRICTGWYYRTRSQSRRTTSKHIAVRVSGSRHKRPTLWINFAFIRRNEIYRGESEFMQQPVPPRHSYERATKKKSSSNATVPSRQRAIALSYLRTLCDSWDTRTWETLEFQREQHGTWHFLGSPPPWLPFPVWPKRYSFPRSSHFHC